MTKAAENQTELPAATAPVATTESTQTAVAPVTQTAPVQPIAKAPTLSIKQLLEGADFQNAVSKALPRHLKAERFIRVALTAMTRVPKLAQCTKTTFFQALLTLSQHGLEPDGRRAHLIPYKNNKLSIKAGRDVYDCQLIIDWKGLSELIYRSGLVATLHADVVRRGDIFRYSAGVLAEHVPHFLRIDKDKPAEPGDVYAAYSTATMKDGVAKCEVMSKAQIDGIRARSKSGQSGPWVTDYDEMAKKTVFRRLSKWLPLSAELRDAVEAGDDDVIDIVAKPSTSGADLRYLVDSEDEPEAETPEQKEAA